MAKHNPTNVAREGLRQRRVAELKGTPLEVLAQQGVVTEDDRQARIRIHDAQAPSRSLQRQARKWRIEQGDHVEPMPKGHRVRRAIAGLALAATTAGVGTIAAHEGVKIVDNVRASQEKSWSQLQTNLRSDILPAMQSVDRQVVDAYNNQPDHHGLHESKPHTIPGIKGPVVDFTGGFDNSLKVVMHTEADGVTPDASAPVFASYHNNTGTGEGTIGDEFTMTTPEGNVFVDQGYGNFGGATEGGWGASDSNYSDTTWTGAFNNPATVSAHNVRQDSHEFPPQF